MGDLRDAFKKAGLIDDKTERRLKHEQRVERKELGREGLEAKERREESERQQREEQKRADVKTAQQRLDHERQRTEKWKRLVALLDEHAVRGSSGPRRFHFLDGDGWLPYVQVDDDTGRRLEAGELALVRLPTTGDTAFVPRAVALELAAVAPQQILHLAGGTGGAGGPSSGNPSSGGR